jgi:hypothetical protein
MKPIRVGLINANNFCPQANGEWPNTHGYYYGALMAQHDPIEFRDDMFGRGHVCYFYFYTNYNDPRKRTVPTIEGFEIVKFWDNDIKQAENMVRLFNKKNGVACKTFEDASTDVDLVFIGDSIGQGQDHLEKATPALERGIPVFVDKPFADNYADAKKMIEMAKKSGSPLLSASMVPYVPTAINFRNRFSGEVGVPEFCFMKGNYFHSTALAQGYFGRGVKAVYCMGKTDSMGWEPMSHIHLEYKDKEKQPKAGVMLCCASGGTPHCAMFASVYSSKGVIHSPPIGDYEFPWGAIKILEMTREMARTGKPPVPYEDILECVAIVNAARLAEKERRRVFLEEITE